MKSRFLSYGAGMQTFALLVMAEQSDIQIDEVVFADTGGEHPETYAHIEKVAKPICDRMGIPFITVRMKKTVTVLRSYIVDHFTWLWNKTVNKVHIRIVADL